VSVHALYGARRQLKEKGELPRAPKRQRPRKKAGKFIAVSVAGAVPGASSGRLGDRVCELAGSELDEAADGRANVMRPCGEDLRIYLHRAPIDMRKGRNALATLAQEIIKVDPFSGALFVYIGPVGVR
jgi:hypothetical protein